MQFCLWHVEIYQSQQSITSTFLAGSFLLFLCFFVALRAVDTNNRSIDRKQTSQSYVATRHWNAGDRCPSLLIKGP